MPKDQSKQAKDFADLEEVDAADTSASRLDAAMREAVAAVEAVEKKKAGKGGDQEDSREVDAQAAEEIERLQKEVAILKDASLRTLADFENYRKRMEREQKEVRRYALLEPMREFLPVVDNLQRALGSDGRAEDLKLGVEMILNQMAGVLQRFDVQEVEALGEVFNPAVHEAVMRDTSSEVTEPTVTDELQKGYILHERLLRPAMVKVSMPETSGPSGGEADSA